LWVPHIELSHIGLLIAGALAFNFTSSVVYIINDFKDIDLDQQHAFKKKRPYAAGSLGDEEVLALAVIMLGLVFMFAGLISNINFTLLLLLYLLSNVFYTYWLKNVPYVDIALVSIFSGMRVTAGFILLGIPVAWYMVAVMVTFFMFMMAVQRLAEISLTGALTRPVLAKYNIRLLRFLVTLMLMSTVTLYFVAMAIIALPLVYTDFLYFFILFYIYEYILPTKGCKTDAEDGLQFIIHHRWILSLIVLFILSIVTILMLYF
jgi:4-hydroxybenzoate polyprenyltransferase